MPSVPAAVAIGASGVDFAIIDTEHGAFGHGDVAAYVHALRAQGCAALVRPAHIDADLIQKALDCGADGVILPGIGGVDDARAVLSMTRYPPVGGRGFSPFTPAAAAHGIDEPGYVAAANEGITCIGIIESPEAVEALEEIVAVGAFDAIYVGAYDLSVAMGYGGKVWDEDFRKEFTKVVGRVRATGVAVGGYVVRRDEDIPWLLGIGATLLTCDVDLAALSSRYQGFAGALKKLTGESER